MKTKSKNQIQVVAVICPYCCCAIFSRAHHDMRFCPCGKIGIDGGDEYTRLSFDKVCSHLNKITINATKKQLYDDWNLHRDNFGIITQGELKKYKLIKIP